MTNDDRRLAFEMRLSGYDWDTIAARLGYEKNAVYSDMVYHVLRSNRVQQIPGIYPAVRAAIEEKYGGSFRALANACGLTYSQLYHTLSGNYKTEHKERMALIAEKCGLTVEEAFRDEHEQIRKGAR